MAGVGADTRSVSTSEQGSAGPPVADSRARLRIGLLVDRAAFAELLSRAIETESDLDCVAVAANARALTVLDPPADVVVVDVAESGGVLGTSLDAVARVWPKALVVVLGDAGDAATALAFSRSGAGALLARTATVDVIFRAVRTAGAGVHVVDATTVEAARQRLRSAPEPAPTRGRVRLTARERDVLLLLGRGLAPTVIAESLGITVQTCRGYLKVLMAKLGAHSQLELLVAAADAGLIRGDASASPSGS